MAVRLGIDTGGTFTDLIGIDDVTGTLEVGKRADVTVWSGSPFSVYSRAEVVIAGGIVSFDRALGSTPSDFELANSALERTGGRR